jgi:hypothetical protein
MQCCDLEASASPGFAAIALMLRVKMSPANVMPLTVQQLMTLFFAHRHMQRKTS